MGEHCKALTFCKRAFDIRVNALGDEHPDVGTSLNNLALLYNQMGKYSEALTLCMRALNIYENVLMYKNSDVATTLTNIAKIYYKKGEYGRVLPYCKRAFIEDATKLNNLQIMNCDPIFSELFGKCLILYSFH